MKFRVVVIGVLLAIIVGLGWLFFSNFEYVYEDEPQPPRGQAIYDPLYAASLVLKAYGVKTVVQPFLDVQALKLGPDDTLVYYGDLHTLSSQASQLYTWVASRGGHLVVQLANDNQPGETTLMKLFGLQTVYDHGCVRFALDPGSEQRTVSFCGSNAMRGNAADFTHAAGLDGKLYYVQQDRGSGWIAALSSMAFMTNVHLKDPTAQALMLRVLQPKPGLGRVVLVYSVDSEGFLVLLFKYGWMVLLPLGLGLLALLLRAAPRFGPPLPAVAPPRRALLEHVRATGEMLWRDGDARALYEAVRADMLLSLRRRHPAASRAKSKELLNALTNITGLPRLRVRRALAQDGVDVRNDFTDRIATLMEIRKRL